MAVFVLLTSLLTVVMFQSTFVNNSVDEEGMNYNFVLNPPETEFLEYEEPCLMENNDNIHLLLAVSVIIFTACLFYQMRMMWRKKQVYHNLKETSQDKNVMERKSDEFKMKKAVMKMQMNQMKEDLDFIDDLWNGKYSTLTFNEMMNVTRSY